MTVSDGGSNVRKARRGAFGHQHIGAYAPSTTTDLGWRIKALATDTGAPTITELYIYDEISPWGVMAADVVQALMMVDTDEILVRLNSPGGSVFDGIAIKNALTTHPATVNVSVDGIAASVASIIALAGQTITMQPGAQLMIHQASGLGFGPAETMRDLADVLDKQDANLAGMYAARAGGTPADWLARMQAETWYSDDEAVAVGLADRKGSAPQSEAQAATASFDMSIFQFKFQGRASAPAPAVVKNDRTAEVYYDWEVGGDEPCDVCDDLASNGPYPADDLPEFDGYSLPHPNCECDGLVPRLGWTGKGRPVVNRTVTDADLKPGAWSCEACGNDFAAGDEATASIDTADMSAEWRCAACVEADRPVLAKLRNPRTTAGRVPGGRPTASTAPVVDEFDTELFRSTLRKAMA